MTKALQPDDLIAHYRVIRALGAGGMGEVYLARDSTLDRDVALKVLPQMAQDDDRVKRFVLEAKSASSLSHPHIITVYEIGCEPVISGGTERPDKVHYIAMELVDGDSFADIIHDNKADLKSVLGYLAQAADGLAKAHASGIVHRDLKPGNIMVSKDGYAKVLDFGLAKLVEKPVAPDATINVATRQALTMEGMIVGTVGYMAPEQILGRAIDHRSDIFSFRLHPLRSDHPSAAVRGGLAVRGAAENHPRASGRDRIVRRGCARRASPAGRALPCEEPGRARALDEGRRGGAATRVELLRDALAVGGAADRPDDVFSDAVGGGSATLRSGRASGGLSRGVSRLSLGRVPSRGDAAVGDGGSAGPRRARRRRGALRCRGRAEEETGRADCRWSGARARARGLRGLQARARRKERRAVRGRAERDEDRAGPEQRSAAVDGSLARRKVRRPRLAAERQIPSADPADHDADRSRDRRAAGPRDSRTRVHAGRRPAVVLHGRQTKRAIQLAVRSAVPRGGRPTRKVTDADTEPTCSPDGKLIAFVRGMPTEKKAILMVAQEDGSGAKPLVTFDAPVDNALRKPRWSPDGKQIAVVYRAAGKPNIVVIDAASGQRKQVGTWEGPIIDSVAWLGATGFVVAGAPAPGPSQLWYVGYPDGRRRRLTNDISDYTFVSTSSDGKTIAARRTQRTGEIWEVPVAGSPADMKQVTQGKENISGLVVAADGTLLYNAPQEETMTLWAFKPGGGKRSIALKGTTVLVHRFIRGQEATAFTAFGADLVGNIHRVNIDGSDPKRLTSGPGESLIAVTPDGKFVLYNTPLAPRTLMSIQSDGGGSPRTLANDYVAEAGVIFSRDGKVVSYQKLDTSQQRVVTVRTFVNIDDGKTIATLPPGRGDQITPDGSSVSYIQLGQTAEKAPLSTVYRIPLAGGTPQKLFEVPDARIDRVTWVDDRTAIVAAFSTRTSVSNLWRWTAGGPPLAPLTDFRSGFIFEFAASHDAKTIYFTQGSNNRDIIKITGLVK